MYIFTVDSEEIRRLSKYFKKLDLNNDGELSVDEFMSIPELQQNPLVRRVIEIMDEDGNGQIDFREFIQGLSQFSLKSDKQSKLRCEYIVCAHVQGDPIQEILITRALVPI